VKKLNKLFLPTLQCDIVHHCNLSCCNCNHFAPYAKKYYVDSEVLGTDLAVLASSIHVACFDLLGGEPLLHPHLLDIIQTVRLSRLTEQIALFTNGLLLHRMKDTFWENIDRVTVTIYPGTQLRLEANLDYFQKKAETYGVLFSAGMCRHFRENYAINGTNDNQLIKRIFSTCHVAHIDRCYNLRDSFIFLCPHASFMYRVRKERTKHQDGIKIENTDSFRKRLLEYLQSPHPLDACSYCLGSVGKLIPHKFGQVNRQSCTTEEIIDWNYFSALEKDPTDNGLFGRFQRSLGDRRFS
jgi:uncharacterized Fe-S cluster-containing radical SAM superfamily protein